MCRLTAYLGASLPLSTMMFGGDHPLYAQSWEPRELLSGTVNADGWGVSWWKNGGVARLARAEPVWFDPGLEGVLASIEATCAMAALRNATPGLMVDAASVAPLALDRWSFILNGFVPGFRRHHMRALRAPLSDALYGELRGTVDTETLFMLAVQAVSQGATLVQALEEVVNTVMRRLRLEPTGECQLLMVMADGESIALCRASNVDRANTLYVSEGGGLAPSGTLIASERLDDSPTWKPVPPQHIVSVTEQGVEITPLDPTGD